MGIDGLLWRLKEGMKPIHLRDFKGKAVVVDAFSWLHRACYGCAYELATGQETTTYVRYMLRKVELIKSYGIQDVLLVFDGQKVPLKAETHEKRKDYKQENKRLARKAMEEDDSSKANSHFQRSVTITQVIIDNVMQALRNENIKYLVAPFEADAQMVWMCKNGLASAIITEDSDVFVYCMTSNVSAPVLFKLDDAGWTQALTRDHLFQISSKSPNPFLRKLQYFVNGDKDSVRMFVQFCIFAGCDFLDSITNVGIVTALKHVFNFRGAPAHVRVQRILAKLATEGKNIPIDFVTRFQQAETLFFHHVVFNPLKETCEFLVGCEDTTCFPDIIERAIRSFDQTNISATSQEDIHALLSQQNGNSFLGIIHTPEIMKNMYEGLVNTRSLNTTRAATCHTTTSDRPPSQQRDPTPSILLSPSERPRKVRKTEAELALSESIENEKRQQVQAEERSSSMSKLLQSYGGSRKNEPTERPKCTNGNNSHSSFNLKAISQTATAENSSKKNHVTPLRELVKKNTSTPLKEKAIFSSSSSTNIGIGKSKSRPNSASALTKARVSPTLFHYFIKNTP